MKQRSNYYYIFAIVVATAMLLTYALWPQPISVETGNVTKGLLRISVEEDGKTRVKDRYVVSAPLSGQLSRIELKSGDKVEAGKTLLAVIDPTDPMLLDARVQAEAEARVKSAQASEQRSSARLRAAVEANELAKHRFQRAKELVTTKAVPQAEFDEAEHEEHIAAESLRAATFALQVAKYELEMAQSAFVRTRPEKEASDPTQRMKIHSPIAGKVLRVVQESATVVNPGQPLVEVGDPRRLEIEIDVLSADATQIQPGALVLLEQWGGDAPLTARVQRVEPAGFTKVSALGVEEQRVNVIAEFDMGSQAEHQLGDAYRVEAHIVIWERIDVIKVPSGALFRIQGEWVVFVVQNGRAVLRTVRIGKNNGIEAEVLEGLAVGDEVILYPSDGIRSGVRVQSIRR